MTSNTDKFYKSMSSLIFIIILLLLLLLLLFVVAVVVVVAAAAAAAAVVVLTQVSLVGKVYRMHVPEANPASDHIIALNNGRHDFIQEPGRSQRHCFL